MSNDHTQSLFETSQYLSEHAKSNFEKMPEKSIAGVLNNAPPSVRQSLATQFKALEHATETAGRIDESGHIKPFAPRNDNHYDSLPKTLKTTVDKLRTEELSTSLMERMGHEQPEQPTTLRDVVSFAMENTNGSE